MDWIILKASGPRSEPLDASLVNHESASTADAAFDVIVTPEALHNIGNAAERDTAVREIARRAQAGRPAVHR